ncbi:hypothetical protein DV735_g4625, partial [Chaetothyriales sp. CBS 134920]
MAASTNAVVADDSMVTVAPSHTLKRSLDDMEQGMVEPRFFQTPPHGDAAVWKIVSGAWATLSGCEHTWCGECLGENIQQAVRSRTSWPPRCCEALCDSDLEQAKMLVNRELAAEWEAKRRLRCPPRINEENKALVRQGLTQQGPRCGCLVEKSEGCDHMTCQLCDKDFCYRCGNGLVAPFYWCRPECGGGAPALDNDGNGDGGGPPIEEDEEVTGVFDFLFVMLG